MRRNQRESKENPWSLSNWQNGGGAQTNGERERGDGDDGERRGNPRIDTCVFSKDYLLGVKRATLSLLHAPTTAVPSLLFNAIITATPTRPLARERRQSKKKRSDALMRNRQITTDWQQTNGRKDGRHRSIKDSKTNTHTHTKSLISVQ